MKALRILVAVAAALMACSGRSPSAPCTDPAGCVTPEPTPRPSPTPIPSNGPCPFEVSIIPMANHPGLFYVIASPAGPTQWVVNGVNVPSPLGVLVDIQPGSIVTACRVGCGCLYPFVVTF